MKTASIRSCLWSVVDRTNFTLWIMIGVSEEAESSQGWQWVVTDIKKNTLAVIASEARQSPWAMSSSSRDCRASLAMTAIKNFRAGESIHQYYEWNNIKFEDNRDKRCRPQPHRKKVSRHMQGMFSPSSQDHKSNIFNNLTNLYKRHVRIRRCL